MYNNELDIEKTIERLYSQNLAVKPGETLLIFTDKDSQEGDMPSTHQVSRKDLIELLRLIALAAPAGVKVKEVIFEKTGGHGIEPPEVLWTAAFGPEIVECLKAEGVWSGFLTKTLGPDQFARIEDLFIKHSSEPVDVVIGLSYYSTSHTRFRDLLTRLFKARYASMPLFDRSMFATSMTADWEKVAERTKRLAELFRSAQEAEVHAPNGTHLKFGLKDIPIHEDTGILTTPGSFGNLPAGEVYLPPAAGTTQGTLVLEWGPTWQLEEQVTLSIENGQVVKVSGNDTYANELAQFLKKDPNYRNIAELGVGTNDKACRADNILESEKILGTIHIALGDNSSFGGGVRTPFHQDFVVFYPTLALLYPGGKKKQILVEGKLIDVTQ